MEIAYNSGHMINNNTNFKKWVLEYVHLIAVFVTKSLIIKNISCIDIYLSVSEPLRHTTTVT